MTAAQLPLDLGDGGSLELPHVVEPMRMRLGAEPFDAADYLFETRWTGIRALASIEAGRVRLRNRRQGELIGRFPELRALADSVADQPLLLDGDIVVVDEHGRPAFDRLQRRLRIVDDGLIREEADKAPACFLASDVLFRGRQWLLREPLQRRKRILSETIHRGQTLYLTETFEGEGRALFDAALDSDLEGILAKPVQGPYTPGDYGGGWLAIGHDRQELVVAGYTMHIAGGQRAIELLLAGYGEAGLELVTHAGPPEDELLRNELFAVLNALQQDQPPLKVPPPQVIACWVRPEVVVTARFQPPLPLVERVRLDVHPDECQLPIAPPLPALLPNFVRPRLTLLTTLPLPFDGAAPTEAAPRPNLRVVGSE